MSRAGLRWVAACVSLAFTMAACASAPVAPPAAAAQGATPPAVASTRTVELGSGPTGRTALVHRPGGERGPMPLVVVLHGAFGTPEQTRAATSWDALADREGFVVAYPAGAGRTWNAGRCCGLAHAHDIDDVDFLHRLVEELVDKDGVDRRRVYAVGMSNGAMMAYAWACARPDDLAGIGPVAGARVADCPVPPTVNLVVLHGTADNNVPIRGGVGPRSVTRFSYPTLAASIAPFLAGDRCTPAPKRHDRAPVHISTFNCVAGAGVTVAVVDGMGHEWPGAKAIDPVRKLIQQKSAPPPIDATAFLWSHLRTSSTIS
jgi:polyhydroxybutyrate depolymerase